MKGFGNGFPCYKNKNMSYVFIYNATKENVSNSVPVEWYHAGLDTM